MPSKYLNGVPEWYVGDASKLKNKKKIKSPVYKAPPINPVIESYNNFSMANKWLSDLGYEEDKKKKTSNNFLNNMVDIQHADNNFYTDHVLTDRQKSLLPSTKLNLKPILNDTEEKTAQKGGFLSGLKNDFEEYSKNNEATPNWLKPIGYALESPFKIPLVNRFMKTAAETFGGEGAIVPNAPIKVNKDTTGNKILDTVADFGGTVAGLGAAPVSGKTNLLNITDDIAASAGNKLASKLGNSPNLVKKLLPAVTRGVVDGGLGNIIADSRFTSDPKQLTKSALEGAAGGALMFGGGKLLGDLKPSNFVKKTVTESKIQPLNPKGKLKPLNKVVNDVGIKPTANEMSPVRPIAPTEINVPIKPKNAPKNDLLPRLDNRPIVRIKKERLQADLPIMNRDFSNVGEQKVKSIQYNHPELKPHIQQEAIILKGELENGQRGGTSLTKDENGMIDGSIRQNRIMSDSVETIKDITGASYDKIEKALDDLVIDHGRENNALSKKIELIIDDRLSNGYDDPYFGEVIPPDIDYLNKKEMITEKPLYKNTKIEPTLKPVEKDTTQSAKIETPLDEVSISKIDNLDEIESVLGRIEDEIAVTQEPQKKAFLINLKLLGEAKRADMQSKFRTNTIERAVELTDDERAVLKPSEFDYVKETSEEWAEEASIKVKNNMDAEMKRIDRQKSLNGGVDAHEAALIAIKLRDEARQTGNYNKLLAWLKTVASKTRETARALKGTDTAWEKKSVDGAIMDTARTVDNVEEAVKKINPKLIDEIENDTKKIIDSLDGIEKNTTEEIAKELEKFGADDEGQFNFLGMAEEIEPRIEPIVKQENKPLTAQEKLADRLDKYTKPQQDMIEVVQKMGQKEKTMLNTLFNIAKESLPEKSGKTTLTPEELISEALKNKDQYADVWIKAKQILKDRFKFDDDRINVLSNYLEKKLRPVFEQKKLNRAIAEELKARKIKLADVVKKHYSANSNLRKSLKETLIERTGVTGEQAEYLSKFIDNRMKELTKQKKEQVLRQMFPESKPGYKPKTKVQKNIRQQVEELINLGAFDNNMIRDLIKQKKGLPTLTKEDINYITRHMEAAKNLPEDSLEQRGEYSLVEKRISEKQPKTLGEKIKAFRKDMMLLNPVTLVTRNPGSNVLLGAAENVKDIPGTLLDKGLSKLTGIRTTGLPEYGVARKGNLKGALRGLKEFGYDIKNGTDTSRSRGQMEIAKGDIFKNPILKAIDKTVNLGLQLGDRPFFEAAFEGRLNELKKLNKVDEPTKDMIEDAMNIALERVLQNESGFSKFGGNIRRAINDLKPGIGEMILPFTQTPGNVLDKAIDYSPIGLARGGGSLNKLRKFANTSDVKGARELQKKAVDQLGRGIVGTGLLAGGMAAANKGLATGKGEQNKTVNEFNRTIGKQNYSAKVGDNYISYDWLQPLSTPFAVGVDYAKEKNFGKGLASGIDTVVKQSFLKGISNMFGFGSPAMGFYNTMLEVPASFVPSVGGRLAKLYDPIQRDTSSDTKTGEMINNIKAKTGLSKTLPPKIDVYGNEMENYGGNSSVTNALLNPAFTSKYKPTKTDNMILDVYNKTGETDIFPKTIDDKIDYTDWHGVKGSVKLTAKEKAELQKIVGQEVKKQFDSLAKSYDKNSKAESFAEMMQKIRSKVWMSEREKFLKTKGILLK